MAGLRTIVTVPSSARVGEVVEVRLLVQHPMETGYRRGSDGELVMRAELHAAVSANPYLAFHLRLPRSGALTVRWSGDRGVVHTETVRISAT